RRCRAGPATTSRPGRPRRNRETPRGGRPRAAARAAGRRRPPPGRRRRHSAGARANRGTGSFASGRTTSDPVHLLLVRPPERGGVGGVVKHERVIAALPTPVFDGGQVHEGARPPA